MSTDEEIVNKALDIFHHVQQDISVEDFYRMTKELFKTIEGTKLYNLITLEDLRWSIKEDMAFHWSTTIRNVNDETFLERFKFTALTTKNYDFYIPIYCLYDFPNNMPLATATVVDFKNLPQEVQEYYITHWQFGFKINKENLYRTEEEHINLKKSSTFLFIPIAANGKEKAMEKAKDSAEDVLHIIRFVYDFNFNLIDIHYLLRDSQESGGLKDLAGLPFCGRAQYQELWGKSARIISDIFNKKNPCDIEKRVKRAIRIYGTQETVTNSQVRYILLMTCLESLLMSDSDKDYILWRLAEKTAFVLGGDMHKINTDIKLAYKKRSNYVHGTAKVKPITDDDISNAKQIVGDVIWKLIIDFVNERGYTRITRNGKDKQSSKSIDEYIEQTKFRDNPIQSS